MMSEDKIPDVLVQFVTLRAAAKKQNLKLSHTVISNLLIAEKLSAIERELNDFEDNGAIVDAIHSIKLGR